MGLPSWKKDGIAVVGHDVVGSPTWESCSRKIPDLNCITRCLGRKVIQNVKANNKQMELQVKYLVSMKLPGNYSFRSLLQGE